MTDRTPRDGAVNGVHIADRAALRDHVDLLTGFPFKSDKYVDAPDAIRLLRGDNVVQGRVRWDNAKKWPIDQLGQLSDYELRVGDVVLAMDRPWIEAGLRFARIGPDDVPCLLVQRVARLRARSQLNQGFLYYLIGSRAFTNHILAVQTGTAVPHISGPQILEFRFRLLPLPEQRAIAQVLGSLDDKIELNRRMNRALEATARAVFRAWFVDFEPVKAKAAGAIHFPGMPQPVFDQLPTEFVPSDLGPIPAGWECVPIGELVEVVGGATPSTEEPVFWEGGEHLFCTPKDMSRLSSPILLDTERHITDAGVNQISSGQLPVGTVLLSSRAPIGYLAVAATPVSVNQGIIAVPPCAVPSAYVFFLIEASMETIKARAGGSTFAEISKRAFRPIPALRPSPAALTAFGEIADPYFRLIETNERESGMLMVIRDALLPRLVSGEARIPVPGGERDG